MAEQVCKWCKKAKHEHMELLIESRTVYFCDEDEHTTFRPSERSPEPEAAPIGDDVPERVWAEFGLSKAQSEPQQASAEPGIIQRYDIKRHGGVDLDDALVPYEFGAVVKTEDHYAQLAALKQGLVDCVEALKVINRLTSPGHRTLDDFMRDNGFACDRARAALAAAAKLTEAR